MYLIQDLLTIFPKFFEYEKNKDKESELIKDVKSGNHELKDSKFNAFDKATNKRYS